MTQRKPPEQSWESFVEEQIRQAQAEGEFENLPGFGRPIPSLDEPHDENWWLRQKLRRENLSALPPGLAIRVEVHKALEEIWTLADEAAVRRAVEAINVKIRAANFSHRGPPSTTMPLANPAHDIPPAPRRRPPPWSPETPPAG
jgi:hypothetical protein